MRYFAISWKAEFGGNVQCVAVAKYRCTEIRFKSGRNCVEYIHTLSVEIVQQTPWCGPYPCPHRWYQILDCVL
jgi:hypothetical protein